MEFAKLDYRCVLQADTRSEVRAMPQRRHGVHSGRRASKPSRKKAQSRSIRWFRAIGQNAHCASMPGTIDCLLQRSVPYLSTKCCLQGVLKALNVNKLTKSGVTFKFWSVLTNNNSVLVALSSVFPLTTPGSLQGG